MSLMTRTSNFAATSSRCEMAIALTKDMLRHCYDMLRASPVMAKYKLPPASEIRFRITRHQDRFAHHEVIGNTHHIAISSSLVGSFATLTMTMAHEQIHIWQDIKGLPRNDGKGFSKEADRICKAHEWDRLIF